MSSLENGDDFDGFISAVRERRDGIVAELPDAFPELACLFDRSATFDDFSQWLMEKQSSWSGSETAAWFSAGLRQFSPENLHGLLEQLAVLNAGWADAQWVDEKAMYARYDGAVNGWVYARLNTVDGPWGIDPESAAEWIFSRIASEDFRQLGDEDRVRIWEEIRERVLAVGVLDLDEVSAIREEISTRWSEHFEFFESGESPSGCSPDSQVISVLEEMKEILTAQLKSFN
ncbi:hypothetical protein ABZW32_24535 [Streptomyces sp. NPDC004667]|uniref:hypothetical protein n=1 Tax=Streptomyces sp. NPDC004667 TaxID=3154285 RepID=UPI0033BB31FB